MNEIPTLTLEAPRHIDLARRIYVKELYITQSALQGICDLVTDAFNDETEPVHEFTGLERNALLYAVQALSRHLAVDLELLDDALGRSLGRGVQS